MKKIAPLLPLILLISSCASVGPAGNWDYSVTGTPQGDYSGVMTVTKMKEGGYAAKLNGQAGEISFDKFSFDKKTKQTKGNFYFSGTDVYFAAQVIKEQMKGMMSAGDMDFPFLATRKK